MIGIFDSGYGGLTIMKEILKVLPEYDYVYLGDNGRAPYGNHTKETVERFTEEAILHLFSRGCQLVIIACFTASAMALRDLQSKYLRDPKSKFKDRKILGVIRPVVESTIELTPEKGRIGIVATRGTVNSCAFEHELKKLNQKITVVQQPCPLLVPLIEEHWHEKPEAKMILKKYLKPLKSHDLDTLILGCTHYPIMKRAFTKMMGKRIKIPDPGKLTASKLQDYLARHPEIEKKLTKGKQRFYFTTDNPEKFQEFGISFLGLDIKKVEKVRL